MGLNLHNRYKIAVQLGVMSMFALGMLCRCANIAAPQGGPRDSLAPRVVTMNPGFGATNFNSKRILIEFDEYIQLKDQQKEFYTSPFLSKKPNVVIRGRGIQIDITEPLDSNQTYSFNFGSSVVDNNESNPYTGLRYVFSTGSSIDSVMMAAYTVDAQKSDTLGRVFLFYYDAAIDSIPAYDSTMLKNRPVSIGRSMPNGIAIIENIKPKSYRIYALEDNNGNLTYEPGVDRVAFLDTVYNPIKMPQFDIWYDTLRNYMQANPQVLMRLFMDTPFKRQTYSGSSRPKSNQIIMHFTAPNPQIDTLTFDGIEPDQIITEYLNEKRDSLALWIKLKPDQVLPDTLIGRVVYQRHDSINQLYSMSQPLKLNWKAPPAPKETKKKESAEEAPAPNPFRVDVAGGQLINPEKNLSFVFEYPLIKADTSVITLEKLGKDSLSNIRTKVTFRQDTMKIRQWLLSAPWEVDQKYRLVIPAGAFENVSGHKSDTLKSEFTIDSPDKFSTIILNINSSDPQKKYIVQITDQTGKNILQEKIALQSGKHYFKYLAPGIVRVRIIDDINGNGKWDTGSLINRRQPEKVEFFVDDSGSEEITTKVNWELEFTANADQIFAPMTMSRINQKIARTEAIFVRDQIKKRAEKAAALKKQDHSSSSSNSGMGVGGAMGGMSGGMGGMTGGMGGRR